MPKFINLTNKQFGRWTVLRQGPTSSSGRLLWECRCECGTEKLVEGSTLRYGNSQSCGCLRRELGIELGKASRKHGEGMNGKETPEYRAWTNMLSRCRNPGHQMWRNYGGRGISVCDRWLDYANFLADMGRRPGREFSLDRIDNEGNYCPENCRWATWEQQNNNRRPSRRRDTK